MADKIRKPGLKAIIDSAYTAIARAAESDSEAARLLCQATEAAIEGERRHRRITGAGMYATSVRTAAHYFVCKWYLDPAPVLSAYDACRLRTDVLYASALRQCLDAIDSQRSLFDATQLQSIDYAQHIAPVR